MSFMNNNLFENLNSTLNIFSSFPNNNNNSIYNKKLKSIGFCFNGFLSDPDIKNNYYLYGSLTICPEFKDLSFEELRINDYVFSKTGLLPQQPIIEKRNENQNFELLNNNHINNNGIFGNLNSNNSGILGNNGSNNLFLNNQSHSLFGNNNLNNLNEYNINGNNLFGNRNDNNNNDFKQNDNFLFQNNRRGFFGNNSLNEDLFRNNININNERLFLNNNNNENRALFGFNNNLFVSNNNDFNGRLFINNRNNLNEIRPNNNNSFFLGNNNISRNLFENNINNSFGQYNNSILRNNTNNLLLPGLQKSNDKLFLFNDSNTNNNIGNSLFGNIRNNNGLIGNQNNNINSTLFNNLNNNNMNNIGLNDKRNINSTFFSFDNNINNYNNSFLGHKTSNNLSFGQNYKFDNNYSFGPNINDKNLNIKTNNFLVNSSFNNSNENNNNLFKNENINEKSQLNFNNLQSIKYKSPFSLLYSNSNNNTLPSSFLSNENIINNNDLGIKLYFPTIPSNDDLSQFNNIKKIEENNDSFNYFSSQDNDENGKQKEIENNNINSNNDNEDIKGTRKKSLGQILFNKMKEKENDEMDRLSYNSNYKQEKQDEEENKEINKYKLEISSGNNINISPILKNNLVSLKEYFNKSLNKSSLKRTYRPKSNSFDMSLSYEKNILTNLGNSFSKKLSINNSKINDKKKIKIKCHITEPKKLSFSMIIGKKVEIPLLKQTILEQLVKKNKIYSNLKINSFCLMKNYVFIQEFGTVGDTILSDEDDIYIILKEIMNKCQDKEDEKEKDEEKKKNI